MRSGKINRTASPTGSTVSNKARAVAATPSRRRRGPGYPRLSGLCAIAGNTLPAWGDPNTKERN